MKHLILGVLPPQSLNLSVQSITFAKAFSRYFNFSLNQKNKVSSYIIKVYDESGNALSEDNYIEYTHKELIEFYENVDFDFMVFFCFKSVKNQYLIEVNLYSYQRLLFFAERQYILSKNNFELIYKKIIEDLFNSLDIEFYWDKVFIPKYSDIWELSEIIENDGLFFRFVNNELFLNDLLNLYIKNKSSFTFQYLLEKLLITENIFITTKFIEKIDSFEIDNYEIILMMVIFLLQINLPEKAEFYLKRVWDNSSNHYVFWQLAAELYLKKNDLKKARKFIIKAISLNPFIQKTFELLLEIFAKSNYHKTLEIFINTIPSFIKENLENSPKIQKLLAIYYLNEKKYLKAIDYIKNNLNDSETFWIYLKLLFHIENFEEIKNMCLIYSDYCDISKYEETFSYQSDMFLYGFSFYNGLRTNNNQFKLIYFKKINKKYLFFSVLNYLNNNNIDLNNNFYKALFFILLSEFDEALKLLLAEIKNKSKIQGDIYLFLGLLLKSIFNNPKSVNYLKKAYQISNSINALESIIIFYYNSNQKFWFKWYLKKRIKLKKNDDFQIYFLIKSYLIQKKYKEAFNLLVENNQIKESNQELYNYLQIEIFYYLKKYDDMFLYLKNYENDIMSDENLSYYIGEVLSCVYKDRKGVFYLQQSYNLNPNSLSKKMLSKAYKLFGINKEQYQESSFIKNIFRGKK